MSIDNDTTTKRQWWNENTTAYDIMRHYAEQRGDLTPENLERFVADAGGSETLGQYAARAGCSLAQAYEVSVDPYLNWDRMEVKYDGYYTVEQLAKKALRHLGEALDPLYGLQRYLPLLTERCGDYVREVALQAVAGAAARVTGQEFLAVLAAIAGKAVEDLDFSYGDESDE